MNWHLKRQRYKGSILARRMLGAAIIALACVWSSPALAQEGSDSSDTVTIHVVQAGEALSDIAAQYNVPAEAIRQANNLDVFDDIVVGQRLIIPVLPIDMARPVQHTVVVGLGDTLPVLAGRSGVSVDDLAALNGIANPTRLTPGQTLWLPETGHEETVNLVRLGENDSLLSVALRYNANIAALTFLNHLSGSAIALPGQVLVVPGDRGPDAVLSPPWSSLVLHPLPLEVGRTGGLRVTTSKTGTLSATFLGVNWPVVSDGTSHEGLIAIDRWTAPGAYPLTLTFTDETGALWTYTQSVLVIEGGYQREQIRLPAEVAAVLSDPAIVQGENAYIQSHMTGFTPEKQWDGLFTLPVAGVLTSGFGTTRSYNGSSFNSFHTGADLAAPVGTPIYAPASGVVVDTGLLDVRGYITIIDHGRGVYTGYWHQSSILVQPGETVAAGQQIGTVGSTGLSTAAHLHWEMWVQGVQVDPMQWIRITFP